MAMGIGGSTAALELANLQRWPAPAARVVREEHLQRIEKAQRLMREIGADALLVGAGASLRYFAGVAWGATERLVAAIILKAGSPIIVCPAFEYDSLRAGLGVEAKIRLWEEDESPFRLVRLLLAELGVESLALDPALPFAVFDGLRQEAMPPMVSGASIIDACRMIKSDVELALMRQAKAMTLEVQRRAARILAPGIKASDVRYFIDSAHRQLGADGGSYFCAVQFAEASSYPHGVPGDQTLSEGDVVLIDTGCQVDGYHSDITRTYVYGEPTAEIKRVWAIEKSAQQAAFDAVRPGVACEAIDGAARSFLEQSGFGPGYRLPGLPHRTGHGIGLSIHEPPYLVRGDKTPLRPGMCFSDEPMIVIPGAFGIRLEDHFHVTENGAAWFTSPQHSLAEPFAQGR
ncbi:MAG: M24 family metallopeptidase [Steroidobacteraceae bacterium]